MSKYAGSYFNYTGGGDRSDPSNYRVPTSPTSTGVAGFSAPVRTEFGGVPAGYTSFRGNVGMPFYGAMSTPEGEQEESSSGAFLNNFLSDIFPYIKPLLEDALEGSFGGGQAEEKKEKPFDIEGAIGDFGPFTSNVDAASKGAADTLFTIVDIFPSAIA